MYENMIRAFLPSVENTQPAPKLMSMFFGNVEVTDTEIVEMDSIYKGARVASFVNPEAVSKGREKLSWENSVFKLPTLKDKEVLTSKDLKKRMMGQNVYEQTSPGRKAAALADGINEDLKQYVENRKEIMAIDAVMNGQITVVGEGENRIIDFGRSGTQEVDLTAGSYWNEATATPASDVDEAIRLAAKYGRKVTHMIGHPDALKDFLANDDILAQLDNRRVENGMLRFSSMLEINDAIYYGTYKNIEIWGYYGNYVDADGADQVAMPANKVAFLSAQNQNKTVYGYAGDMQLDYGLGAGNIRKTKTAQNYIGIMAVTGDASAQALEIHGIQTVAPMLSDPNSTVVFQVLA